jgi:hypothetical protein
VVKVPKKLLSVNPSSICFPRLSELPVLSSVAASVLPLSLAEVLCWPDADRLLLALLSDEQEDVVEKVEVLSRELQAAEFEGDPRDRLLLEEAFSCFISIC